MATELKNLSEYDFDSIPDASNMTFGIVVSEWNYEVTGALCDGAVGTLLKNGAKKENISIKHVPGSFELTYGAKLFAKYTKVDAIIILGCVIQGDTKHFDFICNGVTQGVTDLNLQYDKPVIFGLLTPNTMQQALDRCGGKHGNKGDEAAITAIKMLALHSDFVGM